MHMGQAYTLCADTIVAICIITQLTSAQSARTSSLEQKTQEIVNDLNGQVSMKAFETP